MKRKSKKDDTPIELLIALSIGIYYYTKTKNLNKSVIVFFISIFAFCGITFAIKHIKKKRHVELLLNSGVDIADKMSGEEFEKFLLVHFQKLGYKGETTPKTNDYGADLVLIKNGEKIVVQAKRWASKVGIGAVQQIVGAKMYYKATKCIVVTNNYFTPNAINLASSSSVELWDRTKLLEIMSKSNGRETAKEATNQIDISKRILCPKCNSELILKKGKYGGFYGCSRYPTCKYTKRLDS
ncbi:restriction endonuclease [Clostridium estertheticum]|uniref:restriction endonuclease n=1 Tax=Clostridium estertheticum TaxID=238834 RepID=UPI001C7D8BF4|nr:restriction endonuclease [Clostridium estertheticum]MBX4272206.1 restriction endonuclease [Clostridium estertheticum]WLC82425.1 restriction endonuclease [Clostridium estertheticum]